MGRRDRESERGAIPEEGEDKTIQIQHTRGINMDDEAKKAGKDYKRNERWSVCWTINRVRKFY